jgi:hypothetical protein
MPMILTINACPETFTSSLPNGIVGDIKALDLITPDNVVWIEEDNASEYEGNLDAEFTVCVTTRDADRNVVSTDMIQIDGYNGMWEIKSWDKLTEVARVQLINDFREWAKDIAEDILEQ